jgi:hypothetical protein
VNRIFAIAFSLAALTSCNGKIALRNTTPARGYALGEAVRLNFSASVTTGTPDSIETTVIEKKTGYRYQVWAQRGECDDSCAYSVSWNGRKEDGSWPAGGRYLIFARYSEKCDIYSDTVQIGLGD